MAIVSIVTNKFKNKLEQVIKQEENPETVSSVLTYKTVTEILRNTLTGFGKEKLTVFVRVHVVQS